MDCVASAIAGAREPVTAAALNLLAENGGGDGKATILAHRARAGASSAAFVNGTMAHACDFDDVSEPMCGHPTAPALPAILAVAETRGRSGREVLVALAAAIEVMTKLGRIAGFQLFQSGWHATATLGVFGAAAGAAKVLGLNAEKIAIAIGIAASRASGIRANIGSMVKPLHSGFAARDGVEAALLAEGGATASAFALDGPTGFLSTFTPKHGVPAEIVGLLGNPFDLTDPGIVFKKYPSCWDTHSGVEAVLALRKEHGLKSENVKSIHCTLAPGMGADLVYPDPKTPLQGKFSMEFCSAVALARGHLSLAEFDQHVVDDPAVRRLIAITKITYDPKLASPNPKSFCAAAQVDIELEDGRMLSKTVTQMRGHPKNPMSPAEFEEKFTSCAGSILGDERIREAMRMISVFDTLPDIRPFMAALVPAS
jgi:2-methylcitrate dehydratase PrpD